MKRTAAILISFLLAGCTSALQVKEKQASTYGLVDLKNPESRKTTNLKTTDKAILVPSYNTKEFIKSIENWSIELKSRLSDTQRAKHLDFGDYRYVVDRGVQIVKTKYPLLDTSEVIPKHVSKDMDIVVFDFHFQPTFSGQSFACSSEIVQLDSLLDIRRVSSGKSLVNRGFSMTPDSVLENDRNSLVQCYKEALDQLEAAFSK
jgi:hypothetical protein